MKNCTLTSSAGIYLISHLSGKTNLLSAVHLYVISKAWASEGHTMVGSTDTILNLLKLYFFHWLSLKKNPNKVPKG